MFSQMYVMFLVFHVLVWLRDVDTVFSGLEVFAHIFLHTLILYLCQLFCQKDCFQPYDIRTVPGNEEIQKEKLILFCRSLCLRFLIF